MALLFLIVSVLEFELRKAQDTIKSLRASLTKEAGRKKYMYMDTASFALTLSHASPGFYVSAVQVF